MISALRRLPKTPLSSGERSLSGSDPSARGAIIRDMSRDASQISGDRRLWLSEPCPSCGARTGQRCQTGRFTGKPARLLDLARGWRQRPCPTCKAKPGELCRTPTGRRAGQPHTARLGPARSELLVDEQVWQELGRWGADVALVRFSGGGGDPGRIGAVTLEAAGERELARWENGEGELPEALAAPIWGRYGLFRGHPRITGIVLWDAQARQVIVAGKRGQEQLDEVLLQAPRQAAAPTLRDASPVVGPRAAARACCGCGQPIPAGARPEARYCSKRCRQAASRARLRERSGRAALAPPERCACCEGPMPPGVRPEARYCSKHCRQAASRARLALARAPAAAGVRRRRVTGSASSRPRA